MSYDPWLTWAPDDSELAGRRGRLIAEGRAEAIRNDPKVQEVYFGTGKTFEKRGAAQEQAA